MSRIEIENNKEATKKIFNRRRVLSLALEALRIEDLYRAYELQALSSSQNTPSQASKAELNLKLIEGMNHSQESLSLFKPVFDAIQSAFNSLLNGLKAIKNPVHRKLMVAAANALGPRYIASAAQKAVHIASNIMNANAGAPPAYNPAVNQNSAAASPQPSAPQAPAPVVQPASPVLTPAQKKAELIEKIVNIWLAALPQVGNQQSVADYSSLHSLFYFFAEKLVNESAKAGYGENYALQVAVESAIQYRLSMQDSVKVVKSIVIQSCPEANHKTVSNPVSGCMFSLVNQFEKDHSKKAQMVAAVKEQTLRQ